MDQKEVKSILKATLISNPLKTTVKQLEQEFYKSEGFEIPYKQFGFDNFFQYLYSIPDAVQVIGNGPYAEVRAVLNEKSAHVADMVAKQRTTLKKPRKNSRFNNRPMRVERAKYINSSTQRRNQYNIKETTRNFSRADRFGFDEETDDTWDEEGFFDGEGEGEDEEEPRAISLIKQVDNGLNNKVPLEIQRNLDELIRKFPQGLWCSKLPTEYWKYYHKTLNYAQFDYKSLIQMCCELTKIFKFVKPNNGDYMLFHVGNSLVSEPDYQGAGKSSSNTKCARRLENKPQALNSLTNALDNLRFTPSDIVSPGEVIPQQKIVSRVGEYIDVQIAEVYDPSKFWFNMDVYIDELDKLMDSMQLFYTDNHTTYLIPTCEIQEGLYCVATYLGEYHRAVITNLVPESKHSVKVFFFDYGTVSAIPIDTLCYLHKNFAKFPAQATRGRLAQILPVHEQEMWSVESAEYFLDLIRNKVCVAEIHSIDEESQIYDLVVVDTNGQQDNFINDSLVMAGYARFEHQGSRSNYRAFEPCIEEIYLYPTFDELEKALVPTLQEMVVLLGKGVTLHEILPQYFKKKSENRGGCKTNYNHKFRSDYRDSQKLESRNLKRQLKESNLSDCYQINESDLNIAYCNNEEINYLKSTNYGCPTEDKNLKGADCSCQIRDGLIKSDYCGCINVKTTMSKPVEFIQQNCSEEKCVLAADIKEEIFNYEEFNPNQIIQEGSFNFKEFIPGNKFQEDNFKIIPEDKLLEQNFHSEELIPKQTFQEETLYSNELIHEQRVRKENLHFTEFIPQKNLHCGKFINEQNFQEDDLHYALDISKQISREENLKEFIPDGLQEQNQIKQFIPEQRSQQENFKEFILKRLQEQNQIKEFIPEQRFQKEILHFKEFIPAQQLQKENRHFKECIPKSSQGEQYYFEKFIQDENRKEFIPEVQQEQKQIKEFHLYQRFQNENNHFTEFVPEQLSQDENQHFKEFIPKFQHREQNYHSEEVIQEANLKEFIKESQQEQNQIKEFIPEQRFQNENFHLKEFIPESREENLNFKEFIPKQRYQGENLNFNEFIPEQQYQEENINFHYKEFIPEQRLQEECLYVKDIVSHENLEEDTNFHFKEFIPKNTNNLVETHDFVLRNLQEYSVFLSQTPYEIKSSNSLQVNYEFIPENYATYISREIDFCRQAIQSSEIENYEAIYLEELVQNSYPKWNNNTQSDLNVDAPCFVWNGNYDEEEKNVGITKDIQEEIVSNEFMKVENIKMEQTDDMVLNIIQNETDFHLNFDQENAVTNVKTEDKDMREEIVSNGLMEIKSEQTDDNMLNIIQDERSYESNNIFHNNTNNYNKETPININNDCDTVNFKIIDNKDEIVSRGFSNIRDPENGLIQIGDGMILNKHEQNVCDDKNSPQMKMLIQTEISGLHLHLLLYNGELHIVLNELRTHCTKIPWSFFKRALYLEKSIYIVDINKNIFPDVFDELIKFNLVDEETLIIDLIPLKNLPDVASLLESKLIIPDDFEVFCENICANERLFNCIVSDIVQ